MADRVPKKMPADGSHVIERPDGFYWVDEASSKEYGPFPTLLAAEEDMGGATTSEFEEGETLDEAESEIGIMDWIDPETGQPAEEKTPRLTDE